MNADPATTRNRRVVLLAPLTPAPGGNGLAMRAGTFLDALATDSPVDVVIVPVVGPGAVTDWVRARARHVVVVDPVAEAAAPSHGVAQLADPYLRARLETSAPLPQLAALAPPTLAASASASIGTEPPAAVVVVREYLAPLGINLARFLHADRVVVDLDDDTETLLHELGHADAAAAYGRLARAWLPDADAVTMASPLDAPRVAAWYGLARIETIPNACPRVVPAPPAPGHDRLLFVGNLTYQPNIDAVRELVGAILPAIRRDRPTVTVDIVGNHEGRLSALASPGIVLAGAVADLAPWYADADVVVVPLRHGAGTRIKVLEALAYRRPVVATPTAIAGLHLRGDHDVVIAEPRHLAAAVLRVLADPSLAAALADHGFATATDHYAPEIIAANVRSVVLATRADSRAEHREQ